SLRPLVGANPAFNQALIGFVVSGTPMLQSAFTGARTSNAQDSPGRHPLPTSCFAADASASGTERHMSARPSPSKSTAYLKYSDGRNWVSPMAPPHDERRSLRGTPSCDIFRTCKNSF